MNRQLILVHGRAQENKDAAALKVEWIEALEEGLAKSGLKLPIPVSDVRFPFYGDTLYEMVGGKSADTAAEVIVRGTAASAEEQRFVADVMEEVRRKAGITDEQVEEVLAQNVIDRGPSNWEWVQGILRAIDRHVPHGSGTSISLFTHDVYQYLQNVAIRNTIDEGVTGALPRDRECVVVAHSLGTVVAYNILSQRGANNGWKVPLLVTVGSPLAVTAIKKALKAFATTRCPTCVSKWFNAMDERDVVALYPLDTNAFPLDPANPAIENKTDVQNKTRNRHGIAGYLDDKEVARRIHDALVT